MKRDEKKAQTHQRIMNSAIELFDELGYESTTVQHIADRAEVAKGTFFNYFASKEDLIMELQGMMILQQMENVSGKPGPVIPRMQSVLFEHARQFVLNRSVTRAVLQGIFGSERVREVQQERCQELTKSFVPLIVNAQSRGEIRGDLPAEKIAQLAVQAYLGVLMSWANEQGEPGLPEQMTLTFEVFVRGISP
ncbi:TetR/AcrR family transcriptional regulator [Cohnella faecalis]|uniref:TetR/AcrR family transcriptional regulator n=1 Tax=Cohnella faecalis TaxID=2315694 RepID=A0A398CLW7_9BACL|nr:TetR/AcrR family transcriptional regulator [Cohnella faecalis]RIE03643.1 TetR/AcrR family transcriptional regulator [Cohnella faecalis]